MKKPLIHFLLILLIFSMPMMAQVALNLGDHYLAVGAPPANVDGKVGFAFVSFPGKAEDKPFGFWYTEDKKGLSAPVIEILNVATKKVIFSASPNDLVGGKTEKLDNGSRILSTYALGKGANAGELQIEVLAASDEGMPLGKKITVVVRAKTAATANISASLKLKSEGFAQKVGASAVSTSRLDKGLAGNPSIVVVGSGTMKIDVTPRKKNVAMQAITLVGNAVASKPAEWADVMTFTVAGTTVKSSDKTPMQANRIVNRIALNENQPELVVFNQTDKSNTVPGDTITISIIYHNIGNGLAQEAVIENPIPAGTLLIESSASTPLADVVIERKAAVAPAVGEPTLVRWKVKGKILPGEEGQVNMKVVVR